MQRWRSWRISRVGSEVDRFRGKKNNKVEERGNR